jgi:transcriptional regulator with XRE-family HTH domain
MDEDFSPGWQARLGARQWANSMEIRLRREEADSHITEPVALGRYLIRSRRYAGKTQRELSGAAGVSQSMMSRLERGRATMTPLRNFLQVGSALGRLFPMGCCPHDHACAWQPIRPPESRTSDAQRYIDKLRLAAGDDQ